MKQYILSATVITAWHRKTESAASYRRDACDCASFANCRENCLFASAVSDGAKAVYASDGSRSRARNGLIT